jgi:hypothetical protein
MRSTPILLVPALLVACSQAPRSEGAATEGSRLLGSPTGADEADHGCNVVLRDVHLNLGRDGYESSCDPSGQCWIVWSGELDVSQEADAEGDAPFVTWQAGSDPTWRTLAATRSTTASAPQGFVRYAFTLDANTAPYPGPFNDIQLVPYLQTPAGGRLFDHNRNAGPYDNYVLDAADSYAVVQDASCPAPSSSATIVFGPSWTTTQSGSIVQGGTFSVDYPLARLPQCWGSRAEGMPAWATTAYALFTPGNETASVSFFPQNGVAPPSDWTSSFTVPRDATGVELWFMTSGEGCGPNHYDSSYGANYSFPVEAGAN